MKISVSLPEDDITFIDHYCTQTGRPSRSAVLHEAITLLREHNLSADYEAAFLEYSSAPDDAALWDTTTHDGIA